MEKHEDVSKEPLILREYGRNVQMLVKFITTMPTKEARTRASHALIDLMKQLNPSVREYNDNMQRIWDHLHHMADFQLDIDSPYPVPTPETIFQKPKKLSYGGGEVKFKHYGRNVELLVKKAIELTNEDEKRYAVLQIIRLMKTFYSVWNNDNIEEEVLLTHVRELSKGQLNYKANELQDGSNQQENRNRHQRHNNNTNSNNNPNSKQPYHKHHNKGVGGHGNNTNNNSGNNTNHSNKPPYDKDRNSGGNNRFNKNFKKKS